MSSAAAMSGTVAPEASAFAIQARRPSRRSSAVSFNWAGSSSVFEVSRLLMRANRHDIFRLGIIFRNPLRTRISRCCLFALPPGGSGLHCGPLRHNR
jgi:hypothetical protein